MPPLAILSLFTAAMPILQELLALGAQIAAEVQAAQGTPAAAALTQLQVKHASLVANTVKSLATAVSAP